MKLYKDGDLGMLSMADRFAYVRSLASKFNLKESIQNIYGAKIYVYCLHSVGNHILSWYEEADKVVMATELRDIMVVLYESKNMLLPCNFKPECSISNIERRLSNYNKQVKEFLIKMKKEDIENDFKRT